MPLTGRNNLAETPLLQYLGDQRWRHVSEIVGVPSRDIVDDAGARLYATFYYVEVAFPAGRPMASFGENDRLTVFSSVARYGTSMVDGISYLVPGRGATRVPYTSVQQAVDAGVPAVRLSNIFVRQFVGAQWLKKGRPAHPNFARIPALADPPDSYEATKEAERTGTFAAPLADWAPMTDGPVQREYQLVPDRDLNGAGLVYFANYPMFLDICERDVLASAASPLVARSDRSANGRPPPERLPEQRVLARHAAHRDRAVASRDRSWPGSPCQRPDVPAVRPAADDGVDGPQDCPRVSCRGLAGAGGNLPLGAGRLKPSPPTAQPAVVVIQASFDAQLVDVRV